MLPCLVNYKANLDIHFHIAAPVLRQDLAQCPGGTQVTAGGAVLTETQ